MPTSTTIISEQVVDFNKQMKRIIKDLNEFLNDKLKFTTMGGLITPIDANFENVTIVSGELIQALEDSGYYDLVKEFSLNNTDFTSQQIKEMGVRFSGAATYYGAIEKTVLSGLQNMQYQGMVILGNQNINAIQQALFNSVIAGTSNAQLTKNLTKQLTKFQQHSETYIRTAKREYSQQVEMEIAKEAGITDIIWEYIGAPLQSNSHPECEWALLDKPHAPFFTTAEIEEFLAGGGYDHTEPRWNCQHIFGITDMSLEEYLAI